MNTTMTIGEFLGAAEARLARSGGFSAIVDCTKRSVRLVHTGADGASRHVAEASLPCGVAGEDVANDLLETHAPEADPAQLRFAREVYFPVHFS